MGNLVSTFANCATELYFLKSFLIKNRLGAHLELCVEELRQLSSRYFFHRLKCTRMEVLKSHLRPNIGTSTSSLWTIFGHPTNSSLLCLTYWFLASYADSQVAVPIVSLFQLSCFCLTETLPEFPAIKLQDVDSSNPRCPLFPVLLPRISSLKLQALRQHVVLKLPWRIIAICSLNQILEMSLGTLANFLNLATLYFLTLYGYLPAGWFLQDDVQKLQGVTIRFSSLTAKSIVSFY